MESMGAGTEELYGFSSVSAERVTGMAMRGSRPEAIERLSWELGPSKVKLVTISKFKTNEGVNYKLSFFWK